MSQNAIAIDLPRPWPRHVTRKGQIVELQPLDSMQHAPDLFDSTAGTSEGNRVWDYLPYGPFANAHAFEIWLRQAASTPDPQFYAIVDKKTGKACGVCSFLRIEPAHGVIEVGHIWFAPALQRTIGATEAMFLLFCHVFDELGYRRLEWKCNALNAASRRAATRLGFTFEGIFRQHLVVNGANRDSAWFSLLDGEWPAVRQGMCDWFADVNQKNGQIRTLGDCINSYR